MYLIDVEKTSPGDIIFIKSNSETSKLIREKTGSQYSHAMLVVSVSSCIESDGLGVQAQNIQRILLENPDDAIALRLKKELERSQFEAIVNFARQKVGTEYSLSEAKKALLQKKTNEPHYNRQFCTRFVAQAYENAGIKIVENSDFCLPCQILESDKFSIIPNILRLAERAEIEVLQDRYNPIEKQTKIHCFIFQEARKIFQKDIQTFEQLSKCIIEYPEFEKEITTVVKKSGYLTMWKDDLACNPWKYHIDEFEKQFSSNELLKEEALFFIQNEMEERKRFQTTFKTLQYGYSFRRQYYFKMMIKLYKNLIELSFKREKVALMALKNADGF